MKSGAEGQRIYFQSFRELPPAAVCIPCTIRDSTVADYSSPPRTDPAARATCPEPLRVACHDQGVTAGTSASRKFCSVCGSSWIPRMRVRSPFLPRRVGTTRSESGRAAGLRGAVVRCRIDDDQRREGQGRGSDHGRRRLAGLAVVARGAELLADGTGVGLRRLRPTAGNSLSKQA